MTPWTTRDNHLFGLRDDDHGPSPLPVPPVTRFGHTPRPTPTPRPTFDFERTPRPTFDFERTPRPTHTPRPTAPTPGPTPNYWANKEGLTITTSSACAVVVVFMALACLLAVIRYRRRKNDALKSADAGGRSDQRAGSDASSLAERWSARFAVRGDNAEALLPGVDDDGRPLELLRPGNAWSLLLHAPPFIVVLFWVLMLVHTAFVAFGLVSFWDQVNIKGTASRINDDGSNRLHDDPAAVVTSASNSTNGFDMQVYIATFWINVDQFWQSGAQPVAMLIFFAGVVQPITQMLAVGAIAFLPLAAARRHTMIVVQEATCKVPLAAFYVEAWLLVAFKLQIEDNKVLKVPFAPELDGTDFVATADVEITGFVGLCLFLTGQLLYLVIVNLVRLLHRSQSTVLCGGDGSDDDGDGLGSGNLLHSSDESGLGANSGPSTEIARISSSTQGTLVKVAGDAPPPRRARWRRWLVLVLALLLLASECIALTSPILSFQYTGVIGPYLSADGGHDEKGTLTLSLNLWDAVSRLKDDMAPKSFATYYTVAATIILVVNPVLLALAAIHASVLPDAPVKSRQHVGQVIEVLQCWCGGEAILIASIFIVPNIDLITNFVFDETVQCEQVYDYAGDQCLGVKGRFEPLGFAALCMYTAFSVAISRLCANELHGDGGRSGVGDGDNKDHHHHHQQGA
jgi:hypothetical protein